MFTENQLIILSHSVACWCCSVDRINVTYTEMYTTQTNMSHIDMSHDGDMGLVYCWPSQPLRLLSTDSCIVLKLTNIKLIAMPWQWQLG